MTGVAHLTAQRLNVCERTNGLDVWSGYAHVVCVLKPEGSCMRPIDRQSRAHRSAKEAADRHTKVLAYNVKESILDGRYSLRCKPPRDMACDGSQPLGYTLIGQRVLAEDQLTHPPDDVNNANVSLL
mmetsp:Transcript_40040/g.115409  ORF Transcript_40040/g.115409 Transcript_40040/m.115409 type:complete len:127 (+) Transcript_40040:1093-1473(+)